MDNSTKSYKSDQIADEVIERISQLPSAPIPTEKPHISETYKFGHRAIEVLNPGKEETIKYDTIVAPPPSGTSTLPPDNYQYNEFEEEDTIKTFFHAFDQEDAASEIPDDQKDTEVSAATQAAVEVGELLRRLPSDPVPKL